MDLDLDPLPQENKSTTTKPAHQSEGELGGAPSLNLIDGSSLSQAEASPGLVAAIKTWAEHLSRTTQISGEKIKLFAESISIEPTTVQEILHAQLGHEGVHSQNGDLKKSFQSKDIDQSALEDAAKWLSEQPIKCPSSGASIQPLSSSRPFQCDACKRTFSSDRKALCKAHEYGRYPWEGWVCDVKTVVDVDGTMQCSFCGISNPHMNHFSDAHPQKMKAPCFQTKMRKGKVFHSKELFTSHLTKVHRGIPISHHQHYLSRNRFQITPKFEKRCNHCDYTFTNSQDRIDHLSTHLTNNTMSFNPMINSKSGDKIYQLKNDVHSHNYVEGPPRQAYGGHYSQPTSMEIVSETRQIANKRPASRDSQTFSSGPDGNCPLQEQQTRTGGRHTLPLSNSNKRQKVLTSPVASSNKPDEGTIEALKRHCSAWALEPTRKLTKSIKERISNLSVSSIFKMTLQESTHQNPTGNTLELVKPTTNLPSISSSLETDEMTGQILEGEARRTTLKDRIFEARICTNDNRFYIPNGAIEHIINSVFIAEELQNSCFRNCLQDQCRNLAYTINQRHKKLFGILSIIGKESAIFQFLAEGLCDDDLPMDCPNQGVIGTSKKALLESSTTNKILLASANWSRWDLDEFRRLQWSFLSPVFGNDAPHYEFNRNVVLPFLPLGDVDATIAQGGFSTVCRVKIHPQHHVWQSILAEDDSKNENLFAVKKLHSPDENQFRNELNNLKRLNEFNHAHIIKLHATYRQHNSYHLLFPLAKSDLGSYWQNNPEPGYNSQTARWMLEQCKGISAALKIIHGHRNNSSQEQQNWRHGDLKPDNILVFVDNFQQKARGTLKLADLGLCHIESRSAIGARQVGFSPTYAPPEITLATRSSGASDIWSLGCVFLEFITWLLKGWNSVASFSDVRALKDGVTGIVDDYFFTILPHRIPLEATVRIGVTQWIESLNKGARHSKLVGEFLCLIQRNMLVVDPQLRISARGLEVAIRAIISKMETTPGFLEGPNTNDLDMNDTTGRKNKEHLPETTRSAPDDDEEQ